MLPCVRCVMVLALLDCGTAAWSLAGDAVGGRASDEVVQAIEGGLQTRHDVRFEQVPLRDCLAFLEQASGLDLRIDEEGISSEGQSANLEQEVTLRLLGRRLDSLLNLLLEPKELAWMIENEVLTITTVSREEVRLETRVYDLAPLEAAGYDPDEFLDSIHSLVSPDSWSEVGGPGSASLLAGRLAIRQSQSNHRQIRRLLAELVQLGAGVDAAPARSPIVLRTYRVERGAEEALAKAIPSLIAPETWMRRDADGTVRQIQSAPGVLLVRQERRVHRELSSLVEQLHAAENFCGVGALPGGFGAGFFRVAGSAKRPAPKREQSGLASQ